MTANGLLKQYADAVSYRRALEERVAKQVEEEHGVAGEGDVPSWYGEYEVSRNLSADLFCLANAQRDERILAERIVDAWIQVVART